MPTTNNHMQFGWGDPRSYDGVTVGRTTTDFYDLRTAIAATDGAALTLVVATVPGAIYNVRATIAGWSGTVTSAKYVIGWTVNTAAQAATVTIAAVGANNSIDISIAPDNGSTVTCQVTTLTGTTPNVQVAAVGSRVV